MNAAVLAGIALAAFTLGYRWYARWIEQKVYASDGDHPTPAHETPDGIDYVACNRHVLFGHHFCSVAGAAPIVGPAIAVFWGWLPAFLWVVLGTVLIGAVHDFGALVLSARRGGRTIGDVAGDLFGPRARTWFLGIIVLLTWVVIAAFSWIIAKLFVDFPASVVPINFEILVAVVIGWWITKRKGRLLWPSLIAVTLLYAVVFWGAWRPELGVLPRGLWLFGTPIVPWIVFLLVYSFVASVLPVWVLLQPRDFINSHQLFVGLGALLLGVLWVHPDMVAPAVNHGAPLAGAPMILPFLFITIACGAISGFHALVASGTTSKQLDSMRDARHVGYGAMLGEGTLAVVSILAVGAGLGALGPWSDFYPDWRTANRDGISHFVSGASTFLTPFIERPVAETVVAVIVISFAATTLDTAARIQRFCVGELGAAWGAKALRNRWLGSAFAVVPAGVLAIFAGAEPGKGGFILWPLFGTTNQLIGAITLLLLYAWIRGTGRPTLPVALPALFLFVMTTAAGVMVLVEEWRAGHALVVCFGLFFLLLEALVLREAWLAFRARTSEPGPV